MALVHEPKGRIALLLVVAISAPISLALETGLRKLMFPPEMDEVRALLREPLTSASWVVVGVTALAAVVGAYVQRRWIDAALAEHPGPRADPRQHLQLGRRVLDRLMLSTSIPQAPVIFSTLLVMFGSEFLPAFVAMGVSSGAILLQGVDTERRIARGLSQGVHTPPTEPPR